MEMELGSLGDCRATEFAFAWSVGVPKVLWATVEKSDLVAVCCQRCRTKAKPHFFCSPFF